MFYNTDYLSNNKQFMKCIDKNIYEWIDDYITGKVVTLPKKVIPHDNPIIFCEEDFLLEKMNTDYGVRGFGTKSPSLHWNTADTGFHGTEKDVLNWKDIEFYDKTERLMKPVKKEMSKYWSSVNLKNVLAWFKPKNYMGWHTNCRLVEDKDYRLYFVWCDEDNKSFFRWRDSKTGKIHTKWEKKGWNLNWFQLGNCENPTWHCIYSDCNRFSIGFQVLNPIDEVLSEIQKG